MAAQPFRFRWMRWGGPAIALVLFSCGGGTADDTAGSTGAPAETTVPAATTGAPAETTEPAVTTTGAPVGTTEPAVTTSTAIPASAIEPWDGCVEGTLPQLASFDAPTGAIRWVSCSADLARRTVLGATDEVVIVSAQAQGAAPQVFAFAAASGDELWRATVRPPSNGWAQGPIAGAGVVVFAIDGADGPQLVGLDAMTGATVWEVSGESTPIANTETVAVVRDPAQSQVFSTNPPQVVTTAAPALRGLDRATGAELWSIPETDLTDTSGVGAARGPAAVDGQTVVLPAGGPPIGGGPALVAIDAPTGDLLWDAPMLGHPSAAEATVVGVASSAPNATLTSLELATGEPLWTQPGQPSYGELWAIGDGGVYVLDQTGKTVAHELDDGTVRWSVEQRLGMPQLVIDDGVVLLWEASLAMLSTADGSVRWALDTPVDSTLMNSAGANSTDVVIAVNSLPWGD